MHTPRSASSSSASTGTGLAPSSSSGAPSTSIRVTLQARHWFGLFLASRRRFDEANAQMQRARELDPLSLIVQSGIGRILHFAGAIDEAIAQYRRILQTDPYFIQARIDLAMTLTATGAFAEARAELDRAVERVGLISVIVLIRGCCATAEGRIDEARAALVELRARHQRGAAGADEVGALAYMVGELDEADARLEEACVARLSIFVYLNVEPVARPLATEPRFRGLFERYGIAPPGAWEDVDIRAEGKGQRAEGRSKVKGRNRGQRRAIRSAHALLPGGVLRCHPRRTASSSRSAPTRRGARSSPIRARGSSASRRR